MTDIDRRKALGLAALAAGAPVLAACGSDNSSSSTSGSAANDGASTPTPASGGDAASDALTTTDKVPVGGGAIFPDQKVVVTQPTEGDFKGFSAVCTHESCIVSSIADKQIVCACHGSHFSIADGAVESGPANSPLPSVAVNVKGNEITLG